MYKINYFNFKEKDNKYLITNDIGNFAFLNKENFFRMIKRKELDETTKKELIEKNFIYEENDEIFANKAAIKLRKQKGYLLVPTVLHIFVVSKECNFNCVYCQAGNLDQKKEYKMSIETAKKAVDIALESPSDYLTFEFQGGEPLTNYEVIRYIIEYSTKVANGKKIEYNLVSNLTLLTEEMMNFFIKNNVSICTSIDGNEKLQNTNRIYKNGNSFKETTQKIKLLNEKGIKVNAIETTTQYSLKEYKNIVDTYIDLGLDSIFLRPLTKLGKANSSWQNIGYEPEKFLEFYKKAFEYILKKNKEGILLSEGHSTILLKKILKHEPVNYMELRSPCGGAIGQLAYYYDGNIYTCDEGRMLAEMGDERFKLGNVYENIYSDLMNCNCTKAMAISSCIECIPYCKDCVYMPYCGTCPVINVAQDNNIFVKNPKEYRCKIYSGILDILFNYIEKNDETMEIFENWIM